MRHLSGAPASLWSTHEVRGAVLETVMWGRRKQIPLPSRGWRSSGGARQGQINTSQKVSVGGECWAVGERQQERGVGRESGEGGITWS